ncbi:MAG TPA: hypothetical protein DCE41_04585 [Cytophagales bacterium]|nr:hypothetical protein [Cytophagales bacterium]HAA23076.1 hypothetical protein [Cytophagales bacterium]HAP64276.1 hypothetical protein [Cytophagales bacterium]
MYEAEVKDALCHQLEPWQHHFLPLREYYHKLQPVELKAGTVRGGKHQPTPEQLAEREGYVAEVYRNSK